MSQTKCPYTRCFSLRSRHMIRLSRYRLFHICTGPPVPNVWHQLILWTDNLRMLFFHVTRFHMQNSSFVLFSIFSRNYMQGNSTFSPSTSSDRSWPEMPNHISQNKINASPYVIMTLHMSSSGCSLIVGTVLSTTSEIWVFETTVCHTFIVESLLLSQTNSRGPKHRALQTVHNL